MSNLCADQYNMCGFKHLKIGKLGNARSWLILKHTLKSAPAGAANGNWQRARQQH